MAVQFVKMTESEFLSWTETSVKDYADDKVKSGEWTRDEAAVLSEQEFSRYLPQGLDTPENFLYSIIDGGTGDRVGVIWYAVQWEGHRRTAFVLDFIIFEAFRRRGYATQALAHLEPVVRELGLDSILLHVFAHNHAARELYKKAGYEERNITMAKKLA